MVSRLTIFNLHLHRVMRYLINEKGRLASARTALLKHKSVAKRIMDKVDAYAAASSAFPKVKTLRGGAGKRLRVGSFQVIFEETAEEIIVTGIGPRGGVYD